jgi:hypothetical protein
MKATLKGYAIIMNNSVAKGLNETYSHDRLREDNRVYSRRQEVYCRLRQRLFFRYGFANYHYKALCVCQLFMLEGGAEGILGRECDCVGVTIYS